MVAAIVSPGADSGVQPQRCLFEALVQCQQGRAQPDGGNRAVIEAQPSPEHNTLLGSNFFLLLLGEKSNLLYLPVSFPFFLFLPPE